MKSNKKVLNSIFILLTLSFIGYTILSWILLFRDPRALIGISNLYPATKDFLFSTQTLLSQYGLNSIPTILFALVSAIAVISYFLSLKQKISLRKTIIFALVFQSITFLSYPILSTDIFSYIFSERVATVHHENIWKVKPATFPDDQFGVLSDWKDTTNVYGAVNYVLYLAPSMVGQNDLLTLVLLYKLVPAIFAFGSLFIFYKLLIHFKVKEPEKVFRLIFWNPLLILELFGSGHNDSSMLFFALTAFYLYARNLWLFSGIVLALSVQVKLIPIVLFTYFLLHLLRQKRFIASLLFSSGFIAVNALAFSFMQVNVLEFLQRVAYNGGVYWQSLPNIIQTFAPGTAGIISIIFLLWIIIFTFIQFNQKQFPLRSYVTAILVYLIFVSSAYWNWYVLWIFPFIPFIANKKVSTAALVLTITSLFAYPLLWVIQRINTPSVIWPVLTYLCIFGPPIVLYILALFRKDMFDQLLRKVGLYNLIDEKAYH